MRGFGVVSKHPIPVLLIGIVLLVLVVGVANKRLELVDHCLGTLLEVLSEQNQDLTLSIEHFQPLGDVFHVLTMFEGTSKGGFEQVQLDRDRIFLVSS